jgi:hypothetical protein
MSSEPAVSCADPPAGRSAMFLGAHDSTAMLALGWSRTKREESACAAVALRHPQVGGNH